MKYILLLTLTTYLFAQNTVHSSISTYYESKSFKNSVQKDDGVVYGIGADIHHQDSEYKLTYEFGDTNTKQPPLTKDLKTQKLFLKYAYAINDTFKLNMNYISILDDNIAITDGGDSYGAGVTYSFNKKTSLNFTQYRTVYQDFNINQSDFNIEYKTNIDDVKIKLNSITKYISIDEKNVNGFTKNAKKDYLTSGLKIHSHYKSYHAGAGIYLGKRAFAIMNDGFKVQHHAMEFDRTYALGVGKNISDFVLRFQYVYQRAVELPVQNENVEVKNLRLIINYKF